MEKRPLKAAAATARTASVQRRAQSVLENTIRVAAAASNQPTGHRNIPIGFLRLSIYLVRRHLRPLRLAIATQLLLALR
jgi:hypothetical protein